MATLAELQAAARGRREQQGQPQQGGFAALQQRIRERGGQKQSAGEAPPEPRRPEPARANAQPKSLDAIQSRIRERRGIVGPGPVEVEPVLGAENQPGIGEEPSDSAVRSNDLPRQGITPADIQQRRQQSMQEQGHRRMTGTELESLFPDEPPTTVAGRIAGRFMGTDVSDPQEFMRLATTIAGGTMGSLAGSRVPVLPGHMGLVVNPVTGAVLGGLAGTAAGTAAPEAVVRTAESMGLLPEGTAERTSLSMEELRTVVEGEMLLDLVTLGGVSALRAGQRSLGRSLSGMSRADREIAERAAAMGVDLAPVQLGNSRVGRGFVSVLGRFPIIGTPARRQVGITEQQIAKIFDELPNRVGPLVSRSELGVKIFEDGKSLLKQVNTEFDASYTALFREAEELGVKVTPKHTVSRAREILDRLGREAPVDAKGDAMASPQVLEDIQDFLRREILPLAEATPAGVQFGRQTLRQMDSLSAKIDQKLASIDPSQQRFARALMKQMNNAMKLDVKTNTVGPGGTSDIGRRFAELDEEFSKTMSDIFETSAAKRFGSVEAGGLRGRRRFGDEATRTPEDTLANVILRSDSPQIIDEVKRLVQPETFREIATSVLDDSLQRSIRQAPDGTRRISVEALESALGAGSRETPKKKVLDKLLKDSGITQRELDTFIEAARRIEGLDIPSASTFIARRGVMGGREALVGAMVGGMTAGQARRQGLVGSAIGALGFLAGGRAISGVLADPLIARSFKQVMDKEAPRAVRRAAALEAIRGVAAMPGAVGEISEEEAYQLGRSFFVGMERGAAGHTTPDEDVADEGRRAIVENFAERQRGAARGELPR